MGVSAKKLNMLGLSGFEYSEIKRRLKRTPNELELYLFSAMWSEHCGYKHSKKYIKNLPSKNALYKDENSGGIRIGDHIIFFKTESHNHPCAVEPYQGAATGIGGILRDILAMNARPIALLNSLKFGRIDNGFSGAGGAPGGILKRNRYLLNGVVEGISDYGNSTGVPTIGGEVGFDPCFNLSPIVNVLAVGVCHKNDVKTSGARAGSFVVLIGSLTGRDGLFGASFASKELEGSSSDRLSVQIGDPYTKKKVIEATLEILKSKNVFSSQDLGAAGILSSTSEMADKGACAIELQLDKVPLCEKNMQPFEIMLSESQERMVFCANSRGVKEIFEICKKYELNASVIGKTLKGNTYSLFWGDKLLCKLETKALTEPPLYDLNPKKPLVRHSAAFFENSLYSPGFREFRQTQHRVSPSEIKRLIFKLAAAPEFAGKRYIYRQYDDKVGARTLKNPHSLGVSPLYIFEEGVVAGFSMDSNERMCAIDPYRGAFNTVFESFRNAVSSGFEPKGITNCLNFANPENPETAYQFIQTIEGMKDALNLLKIPVASGNVSFYNEGVQAPADYTKGAADGFGAAGVSGAMNGVFPVQGAASQVRNVVSTSGSAVFPAGGQKIKIHPVPVIGMMSALRFKTPIYSMFQPGETLLLLGKKINENSNTTASLFYDVFFAFGNACMGKSVDTVDFELEMKLKDAIFYMKKKNLIGGAIDVSKGGALGALIIALSNSTKTGVNIGFKVNPAAETFKFPDLNLLFGEITGRYLVSTTDIKNAEDYLNKTNTPYEILGKADETGILDLNYTKINLGELCEIYENSLERKASA